MKERTITDMANRWTGAQCYLDGQLAIIAGRLLPHAIVSTMDNSKQVEFAWPTVERIMFGRMEFKS